MNRASGLLLALGLRSLKSLVPAGERSGMGQLAIELQNPKNRERLRREGGRFEYGDPIPMIEDLVVTRQVWPDATILANDDVPSRNFGYLAFWEPLDPTLNFILPRHAVETCPDQGVQNLFGNQEGRGWILKYVEKEGLKGFNPQPEESERASSWSRLLVDDMFS